MPKRLSFIFAAFILAGAVIFSPSRKESEETLAAASTEAALAAEQNAAYEWFAGHQRLIEELDRNWIQYHRILDDFENDVISIETTNARLQALADEAAESRESVVRHKAPEKVGEEARRIMDAVTAKTASYAESQLRAIKLTAAASDPERQLSENQEEQSRHLRDVMNVNAPQALFTAREFAALKRALQAGA